MLKSYPPRSAHFRTATWGNSLRLAQLWNRRKNRVISIITLMLES
jgi:hypothetical protein